MWPKDVRAERRMVTGGGVAYTLYHATVGELGQILLQPLSTGGCQMTCEVLDRPDGLKEERSFLTDDATDVQRILHEGLAGTLELAFALFISCLNSCLDFLDSSRI